jgi:pimeloyl-ACP methyl ester carboxylesterase
MQRDQFSKLLEQSPKPVIRPNSPPMIRRNFIASVGLATTALSACAGEAASEVPRPGARGPIVLVHGAWHGGWCWQRLVPLLAVAGHTVYTPTLTGLGDRAHLARPDINLDLHTRDLQAFLEMEGLQDVTLVGHSYAGFIISMLAERARSRLRRLVYLDAFLPEDGKSALDYIQPPQARLATQESGQATGYVAPLPLAAFGLIDPVDVALAQPRIVAQPFGTLSQPIRLAQPAGQGVPRSFIECVKPTNPLFGQFAARARAEPDWDVYQLPTGHDAMIIAPALLADMLLSITRK